MPSSTRNKATYASVVSRGSTPQDPDQAASLSTKEVIVVSSRESTPTPTQKKGKVAKSSKSNVTKSKAAASANARGAKAKKVTVKKEHVEDEVVPSKAEGIASKSPTRPSESDVKESAKPTKSKAIASNPLTKASTVGGATPSKSTKKTKKSSETSLEQPAPRDTDKAPTAATPPASTQSKKKPASARASKAPSPDCRPEESDPESEVDAGARLDPTDTVYRASAAKNRVEAPATRSSSRVRKSKPSQSTKTGTADSDDVSLVVSDIKTPTKASLGVSQPTDGGSAKRGRREAQEGKDSDDESSPVVRQRTKRIKVAVVTDPESDTESMNGREPDDVEMADGTGDSEEDGQSEVEGDGDEGVESDENESENEDGMLTDDDAGFIDDSAIESDHSGTEEEEGEDGSEAEGRRSSSPQPPTSSHPPMRTTSDNDEGDEEDEEEGQGTPRVGRSPHPSVPPSSPHPSVPPSSPHASVPPSSPIDTATDGTLPAATSKVVKPVNNKGKQGVHPGAGAGSFKRVKGRRTFGSVVPKGPEDPSQLGDLEYESTRSLPDRCGVTDSRLQDPELKATYADRPNLIPGQFNPWNDAKGRNMMMFSRWVDSCPDMDYENALNVIEFVRWNRYINPSQMSPLDVLTRRIPGATNTLHLYAAKRKPAICVSLTSCSESCIYSFPKSGAKHKRVGVRFHSQEWERLVAFACMVFRQRTLEAQLSAGVLQISTRFLSISQNGDTPTTPSKPTRYAAVTSPAIGTSTASSYTAPKQDTFTLDAMDEIKVYDARSVEFNMKTDIDKRHELPLWNEGEIPEDSCIAVAYTLSSYKGKRGPTISFNLQWIIVFGTPS